MEPTDFADVRVFLEWAHRWSDSDPALAALKRIEEQLEAATKALETPRQYDVLLSDMKEQFEALRNFNEATRRAYATLTSSEVSSYPSKDSGVGPGPSDSATSSPATKAADAGPYMPSNAPTPAMRPGE